MFVKNTLSANQISIFNNFFKKTNEIHSHNTRHTSRNTVELPQPMTESYGRYSARFQVALLGTICKTYFLLTCYQKTTIEL